MNGMDLFSGIGGISKALEQWVKPVIYCEIDTYCQGVLLSRMADESISDGPIWDDITTLSGCPFNGSIDIIYGGFPCQDVSIAGNGKGLAGERSGLFFEILRLAEEIKPKYIFLENVPAITSRGGLQVVREITALGYDCRWCVISAASVGALHRRERWFLLAHAKHHGASTGTGGGSFGECPSSGKGSEKQKESFGETERTSSISANLAYDSPRNSSEHVCNTDGEPSKQTDKRTITESSERRARRGHTGQSWPFESRDDWQKTVSEMGKCSDGVSNHVARLKALGNSVVPAQVKEAFQILMGIK